MQVEAQALKDLLTMLLLAVLADRALHGYAIVEALRQRKRPQGRPTTGHRAR